MPINYLFGLQKKMYLEAFSEFIPVNQKDKTYTYILFNSLIFEVLFFKY